MQKISTGIYYYTVVTWHPSHFVFISIMKQPKYRISHFSTCTKGNTLSWHVASRILYPSSMKKKKGYLEYPDTCNLLSTIKCYDTWPFLVMLPKKKIYLSVIMQNEDHNFKFQNTLNFSAQTTLKGCKKSITGSHLNQRLYLAYLICTDLYQKFQEKTSKKINISQEI